MKNRVAIVTGGARGIGAATAKLLGERGASVVVNYVSSSGAADDVVREIREKGGKAISVKADVRNADEIHGLVEQTKAEFGGVDILVSNANMSFVQKPQSEMRWEEFSQKLNDEMKSSFELTQAVVPHMKDKHYGRLIYISSGLSRHPSPGFIAHGSAKAALSQFVRFLAQEVGPFQITANIVAPGLIETDATANMPGEAKEQIRAMTPLGHIGRPEDLAGVIAFFAGEDSRFVTGTYLPVNGGIQMD